MGTSETITLGILDIPNGRSVWNTAGVQQTCLGYPLTGCIREIQSEERSFFNSCYRRYVLAGLVLRLIAGVSLIGFLIAAVAPLLGVEVPDIYHYGLVGLLTGAVAVFFGSRIWPNDLLLMRDRRDSLFEVYSDPGQRFVRCTHSGLILSVDGHVNRIVQWAPTILPGVQRKGDQLPTRVRSLDVPEDAIQFRAMSDPEAKQIAGLVRCGLAMWLAFLAITAVLGVLGYSEFARYGTGFSFVLPAVFWVWLALNLKSSYWEAYSLLELARDRRRHILAAVRVFHEDAAVQLEVLPYSHFVWSINALPAPWRAVRK